MKSNLFIVLFLSSFLAIVDCAGAQPKNPYLQPALKPGEQYENVFSKTVSIRGKGFKTYVGQIGGTAHYVVEKVTPDSVIFDLSYRYDGHSSGNVQITMLSDQITYCVKGDCHINRQTSGLVFNPLLWGDTPKTLRPGATWTVHITKPWEIGPPGTERVRVLRTDPDNYEITLVRHGHGKSKLLDDKHGKGISITTDEGETIKVHVIPGKTTWSGYTTICSGIIIGDEIIVKRDVTLVTADGKKFRGTQRTYTLLNLSRQPSADDAH